MLKLTVLADNNTFIDRYYLGEPGVSYYLETGEPGSDPVRILFDTGYSDVFLRNALKMGIDPGMIDFLVLSHGHSDHTWGLDHLIKFFAEAMAENRPCKKPKLVAHPAAFLPKREKKLGSIGPLVSMKSIEAWFEPLFSPDPVWITDTLLYLGEIERRTSFENLSPIGQTVSDTGDETEIWEDDFLIDDTALAYRGAGGLTVITGCSHAGICNIVGQAKRLTGEERILDVIGGFHLQKPRREQLEGTVDYFKKTAPVKLHACHCVDLESKIALAGAAPLEETGSGLVLHYD